MARHTYTKARKADTKKSPRPAKPKRSLVDGLLAGLLRGQGFDVDRVLVKDVHRPKKSQKARGSK